MSENVFKITELEDRNFAVSFGGFERSGFSLHDTKDMVLGFLYGSVEGAEYAFDRIMEGPSREVRDAYHREGMDFDGTT